MTDQLDGAGDGWITLGDYARRLGISRAGVYGRIKRGTLNAKRANRGGYLVRWPPPEGDGNAATARDGALQKRDGRAASSVTVTDETLALQAEVAELREGLAAERVTRARVEGELAAELRRAAGLEREL